MPPFIPGLELSQRFYNEAVRPILAAHEPQLRYAAARLDSGSDVLGYDTPQSTDHDWGPRLQLFLEPADLQQHGPAIDALLARELPPSIGGWSTHFGPVEADGSRLLSDPGAGPISHRVELSTLAAFIQRYLGYDPATPPDALRWLTLPEQRLLTLRSGRVFHDEPGQLTALRQTLHYYPHEVWVYLLAAQWTRIGQEEPFVARCGVVGDELGSRITAARLVRDVMKLCFLIERQYAPYSKWFGTAFAQLPCASSLQPLLARVLAAPNWQEREQALSEVYSMIAGMHNALGLTPPLPTEVSQFYSRPYLVIQAETFAEALRATLRDPMLRAIPTRLGSIDQFADSTDLLTDARLFERLRSLYS